MNDPIVELDAGAGQVEAEVTDQAHALALNPVNRFVGLTLQMLRHGHGIRSAAEVAGRLGISLSTYRLVEAGRMALPAYCAPAVAELFKLPLGRVAAALSLVAYLNDPRLDQLMLRERTRKLAALDPRLAPVADGIDGWIKATPVAASQPDFEQTLVTRMMRYLAVGPDDPPAQTDDQELLRLARQIPPIERDAFEDWVAHVGSYAPVMSLRAGIAWFASRATRVKRVRAYVTGPLGPADLTRGGPMMWDYLRNPHEPTLEFVITPPFDARAKAGLVELFMSAARDHPFLNKTQRRHREALVSRTVRVESADEAFSTAMRPFQLSRRPGNPAGIDVPAGKCFTDLWFIDYFAQRDTTALRTIGILAVYAVGAIDAPVSGYLLVLDQATIDRADAVFDREWQRLTAGAR